MCYFNIGDNLFKAQFHIAIIIANVNLFHTKSNAHYLATSQRPEDCGVFDVDSSQNLIKKHNLHTEVSNTDAVEVVVCYI